MQVVTKFQSSYAPDVSILSYLERIGKYAKCSVSCFVVALIYIDRMIEKRNLALSPLNVHRILITSVLIAAKFLDDFFYNNAFYARLGGITTSEMNGLELEFLLFLGFSLNVTSDQYAAYHTELRNYVGLGGYSCGLSYPLYSQGIRVDNDSNFGQLHSITPPLGHKLDAYSCSTCGSCEEESVPNQSTVGNSIGVCRIVQPTPLHFGAQLAYHPVRTITPPTPSKSVFQANIGLTFQRDQVVDGGMAHVTPWFNSSWRQSVVI